MRKVYLVSYATGRFKAVQHELNESARAFGIDKCISYSDSDLHSSDYYLQNKDILDDVCGAGFWAWKPYFILSALKHLQEGDILLYCDAGSLIVESPQPLVELAAKSTRGIILFDARPLRCRQFTKRDCFVRMNCDSSLFWNANKIIATILVVRKCPHSIAFLKEWLYYCKDRAVISHDPNECGLPDLPGFIQHRWDQSILNVLAAKYRLETYRNPTLWGNFLKLHSFRVTGEPVASPYNLLPEIQSYSARPQKNSPYGTIFEINRNPNFEGKPPIPAETLSQASQFLSDDDLFTRLCSLTSIISRKLSPGKILYNVERLAVITMRKLLP